MKVVNFFKSYSIIIIIVIIAFFILSYDKADEYDVAQNTYLMYNIDSFNPEANYLAINEIYSKANDYSSLEKNIEGTNINQEEIIENLNNVDASVIDKVNSIDMSYKVSKEKVTYGDEISIIATYNAEKAAELNLKITNPDLSFIVTDIPQQLTDNNLTKDLIKSINISNVLEENEITYDKLEISEIYLNTEQELSERSVIVKCKLTNGIQKKLLFNDKLETVYISFDGYLLNDKLVAKNIELEVEKPEKIESYQKLN